MAKRKSKSESSSLQPHYIAIVAIIAVVAVVILVMNSMKTPVEETGGDQALVGQAYGPTIIDKNEFFDKYGDYADKDLTFTKESTKYCFQPHLKSYFKLPPRITKIIPKTPPRREASGYEWYLKCNNATGEYCNCIGNADCTNYDLWCVTRNPDRPEIGSMCTSYADGENECPMDVDSEGNDLKAAMVTNTCPDCAYICMMLK